MSSAIVLSDSTVPGHSGSRDNHELCRSVGNEMVFQAAIPEISGPRTSPTSAEQEFAARILAILKSSSPDLTPEVVDPVPFVEQTICSRVHVGMPRLGTTERLSVITQFQFLPKDITACVHRRKGPVDLNEGDSSVGFDDLEDTATAGKKKLTPKTMMVGRHEKNESTHSMYADEKSVVFSLHTPLDSPVGSARGVKRQTHTFLGRIFQMLRFKNNTVGVYG